MRLVIFCECKVKSIVKVQTVLNERTLKLEIGVGWAFFTARFQALILNKSALWFLSDICQRII